MVGWPNPVSPDLASLTEAARRLATCSKSVSIAIDDLTRPSRLGPIVKAIVFGLEGGGISESHIDLVIALGVPCVTLCENTERPVTIEAGANRVAGNRPAGIQSAIAEVLSGNGDKFQIPEHWDGKAAERIVNVIIQFATPDWWKGLS